MRPGHHTLPHEFVSIKASRAAFCIDCESLFDSSFNGDTCPACGSKASHPLVAWIRQHPKEGAPKAAPRKDQKQ